MEEGADEGVEKVIKVIELINEFLSYSVSKLFWSCNPPLAEAIPSSQFLALLLENQQQLHNSFL
jgi:hypothetical protein